MPQNYNQKTVKQRATPEQEEKIRMLLANNVLKDKASQLIEQFGCYFPDIACQKTEEWLEKFITNHPAMIKLKGKVRILSNTYDPVLIVGESGTGKELLAQALHGERGGKFLSLNCGALPINLLESELFGHVVGAFTGAMKDKTGIFQAAGKGTVFLDEIGELQLTAQSALLRTLQEGTIRKIGSNVEEAIECRVVCATWHDLQEEIKEKRFREDLYHRIGRVVLRTLPLRERGEDLELIMDSLDNGEMKYLTSEARAKIRSRELKGNVRELENLLRNIELFGLEILEEI